MRSHWLVLTALVVFTALSGCGDNSSSLASSTPQAQSKRVVAHTKAAAADYQNEVQSLYVAYFGRPADPTGLANFEGALLAAGAPTDIQGLVAAYSTNAAVHTLINSFGTSAESQSLYAAGDTSSFVNAVFLHVLGRLPQSSGLNYWSNAISSGALSQGEAALSIMAGALANNTPQGVVDAQLVNSRLYVATSFTAAITTPATLSSYSGATAAQAVRNMLSTVTSKTDTYDFQTVIYSTLAKLVASNASSFAIDAAETALFQSAQSFKATYIDTVGNVFVLTYTSSASTNTTLAGQAVKASSYTIAITENGTPIFNEPVTAYFQTGPFKLISQVINNSTYVVASNQTSLPAFASIGSSGPFCSAIGYADGSMKTVVETLVTSWNLASSPTVGTANLCVNGVATLTSGASATSAACYQIDTSGKIYGQKVTFTINGKLLVFDSSVTSIGSISVPTPTTQGCGAAGGSGSGGVSFVTTSTGSIGYFTDSNSYAGKSSEDTFTYGLVFNNPTESSTATTGSLRVRLWAFPTSYQGFAENGYIMATLTPNLTGPGAYSSNQLYNFSTATAILSTATGTNPPAGTYCVAALLDEYTQNCQSADGYCTIDWRNIVNPQTFY